MFRLERNKLLFMTTEIKFNLHEKRVKEAVGPDYSVLNYVEGVDYVKRKAFKSERIMFRSNFLEKEAQQVSFNAEVAPTFSGSGVFECKVAKVYPNFRYVETDTMGRIYAGGKGNLLRKGQVIRVKNSELYLGKDKTSDTRVE